MKKTKKNKKDKRSQKKVKLTKKPAKKSKASKKKRKSSAQKQKKKTPPSSTAQDDESDHESSSSSTVTWKDRSKKKQKLDWEQDIHTGSDEEQEVLRLSLYLSLSYTRKRTSQLTRTQPRHNTTQLPHVKFVLRYGPLHVTYHRHLTHSHVHSRRRRKRRQTKTPQAWTKLTRQETLLDSAWGPTQGS